MSVDDIYFGTGKVLGIVGHFTTIIELSTVAVAPETARWLHEAGGRLGLSLFDAGISGSTLASEFRILTLFGGRQVQVFEAAQPIFRAIAAANVFHRRPSGSDGAMKLVVSTFLGRGVQAIAEAVALVAGLGMLQRPYSTHSPKRQLWLRCMETNWLALN